VWSGVEEYQDLIDPMTGDVMGKIPLTSKEESKPFIDSLNSVPKHGLHNPFKAPERYLMYGDVSRRAAEVMNE
jgi:1-pyrroline-5-carboxylate dehydrogenase